MGAVEARAEGEQRQLGGRRQENNITEKSLIRSVQESGRQRNQDKARWEQISQASMIRARTLNLLLKDNKMSIESGQSRVSICMVPKYIGEKARMIHVVME